MDHRYPTTNYRRASRQDQTLNAIVDFRYLAPAKLARDESHERVVVEAALLPLVNGHEPLGRPLQEIVLHRLVRFLILFSRALMACLTSSPNSAR